MWQLAMHFHYEFFKNNLKHSVQHHARLKTAYGVNFQKHHAGFQWLKLFKTDL